MSNVNTNAGYGFGHEVSATSASAPESPLYPHHSAALASSLIATAQALVHPRGKGIYATDETPEGIEARLVAAAGNLDGEGKVLSDEERRDRRKNWRQCLYETLPTGEYVSNFVADVSKHVVDYISGVILYHETLHDFQLAPLLSKRGIVPGVRADTDSHPLPISPLEPATQGLDDLLPRLQRAYKDGARFSKWRAPFLVDAKSFPSQAAIEAQAESLARFAAISQQAGLVPIVEPDLDFGGDADMKRSVEAHVKCISAIYSRCFTYGVLIEGS
jgi:fructose-bisphosphate aldolase class I